MVFANETNLQLEAKYINWMSMMFIRCFCLLMIPLGIVGHSLSIFVFTRRSIRTNPCVMYFQAATIFGFLNSGFVLPMRLIQAGYFGIDPTVHSIFICKIVWFILYSIRLLSFWMIVLACIDRYLCSSPSMYKRAWSSTRVASRAIPSTILLGFFIYIHIPIMFKIYITPITQKIVCHGAGPPGPYRKFLSLFNLIIFGLGPPLSMLIFGLLTLNNINRKNGFNTIFSTNLNMTKIKTSERQLLRMLLTQVFIYSITGLMFSIGLIIIAMDSNRQKNALEIAKENLLIAIVGMLSNTGPCLSFYLFTLSSRFFRQELKKIFNHFFPYNFQSVNYHTPSISKDSITKQQQMSYRFSLLMKTL